MAGILKVGLTGGIACGRSSLSRHLRRPGWHLIDADAIVHGLLYEGGRAVEKVIDAFGAGVESGAGGVDRKALGGLVFCDTDARRRLEAIIHPMVTGVIEADTAAFAARVAGGIIVVDAALMVETGSWRRYDRLVVAHCPPPIQLARLMARDGMGEAQARARISAQAPLQEKIDLADYTIDTSGSLEETRARTLSVAERLEEDQRGMGPGGAAPGRSPE
jgi:dephospho-CoA kinase